MKKLTLGLAAALLFWAPKMTGQTAFPTDFEKPAARLFAPPPPDFQKIYGDLDSNYVKKVKTFEDHIYVAGITRFGDGIDHFTMSKFNLTGNLVWQKNSAAGAVIEDFEFYENDPAIPNDGWILAVGRTPSSNQSGVLLDNNSLFIRFDELTGNVLFARQYEQPGRESFFRIARLPNAPDPDFPFYVTGAKNHFPPASTVDLVTLFNFDPLGNLKTGWPKEYISPAIDNEFFRLLIPVSTAVGRLVLGGNDSPAGNGILVSVDAMTGAVLDAKKSDLVMDFNDGVNIPPNHYHFIVGTDFTTNEAMAAIITPILELHHGLRYQEISYFNEAGMDASGKFYASGQHKATALADRWPVLHRMWNGAALNHDWSRYFEDGEFSFLAPHFSVTPVYDRIFYGDTRVSDPSPTGFFHHDKLIENTDLEFNGRCKQDFLQTPVPLMLNMNPVSIAMSTPPVPTFISGWPVSDWMAGCTDFCPQAICLCGEIEGSETVCLPTKDQFHFEVVVENLSGATTCGLTISPVSSGVSFIGTPTVSWSGAFATISGDVQTTAPFSDPIYLTVNMECECENGLFSDCALSVALDPPCCYPLTVENASFCHSASSATVSLAGYADLLFPSVIEWFVAPSPCTSGSVWVKIDSKNSTDVGAGSVTFFPSLFAENEICLRAVVTQTADAGPCRVVASNAATIHFCEPFSGVISPQKYCWTGTPIVPAPLFMKHTAIPATCPLTVQWHDSNGPIAGATGFTFQPPPLVFTGMPTDCESVHHFFAVISGICGSTTVAAAITLFNDDAPAGMLEILQNDVPPDVLPLCPGEDLEMVFTPGCGGGWTWLQSSDGSNFSPIDGAGNQNGVWFSNAILSDQWFQVFTKNGVCPADVVPLFVDVVEPLEAAGISQQLLGSCLDAGLQLSVDFLPAAPTCAYEIEWFRNGSLIHVSTHSTSPAVFDFIETSLMGHYEGTYYAVVKSTCCPADQLKTNTIDAEKGPKIEILAPAFRCNDEPITLEASILNDPGGCLKQWFEVVGGSLVVIAGATGNLLTADHAGTFLFQMNCGGCVQSASVEVTQCTSNPIILRLGNGQVQASGETVCLPVTVGNFKKVAGFQFSVNWNFEELTFIDVQNFNPALAGFGPGNFVASASNGFSNDRLSVLWLSQNLDEIALPDGATLFSLCFQVNGKPGAVSYVQFSDVPTAREIVDSDGEPLPPILGAGSVSVVEPLHLYSLNVGATVGQQICLPVKLDNGNFYDLVAAQFSMNWDPAVLQFTGVQSFGLPGLSASASQFGYSNTASGSLLFSWNDPTAIGVSLPDHSTLFEVCFTVVGAAGTSSPFNFSNSPVAIEFVDTNDLLPFTVTAGGVTVVGPQTCGGNMSCQDFTQVSPQANCMVSLEASALLDCCPGCDYQVILMDLDGDLVASGFNIISFDAGPCSNSRFGSLCFDFCQKVNIFIGSNFTPA